MRVSGFVCGVFSSAALLVSGCGGNGNSCVIDSDCREFGAVCIDSVCQPPGGFQDGGDLEAGRPDTGPARRDAGLDANVMDDAGPDMDAGSFCAVDVVRGQAALPTECLPRCDSALLGTLFGCGADTACITAALAADTTAGAEVQLAGGEVLSVTCEICYTWQEASCTYEPCATQEEACVACGECDTAVAGCEAEETALADCRTANVDTINTCRTSRPLTCIP